MPTNECTVCALDTKVRRLGESLLRAGVRLREVAEYLTWQGEKAEPKYKISKSALDRHKNGGHFVLNETVDTSDMVDEDVKSLRDYARELFKAYQKANKGKVPSTKELIDFLLADAKLADIEARRSDEAVLRDLFKDASFKSTSASRQPEVEGNPDEQQ